jgi:hypothetical protein
MSEKIVKYHASLPAGHFLVFLPGAGDIEQLHDKSVHLYLFVSLWYSPYFLAWFFCVPIPAWQTTRAFPTPVFCKYGCIRKQLFNRFVSVDIFPAYSSLSDEEISAALNQSVGNTFFSF